MKKSICVIIALCLVLSLAACGNQSQKTVSVDTAALYESLEQHLPEMFYPDEDTMLNFLGIRAEDCVQYQVAICAEGLRADEVWLIEAKDAAALETLNGLAQSRIQAKLEETETYAPDQFLIVQQAEVWTNGNYLVLLISPEVATLKASVEAAFQ